MRVFFYLLYHQLAWLYNCVAAIVSLGMWTTWIEEVLPHLTGLKVLELGHGTGDLQIKLHQQGIFAFGIDESASMGRLAQAKARRGHQPSRLLRGVAQHLPFPSHCFDHIVATFPSDYLFDPQTLHEAFRALAPGGTLVVLPTVWITGRDGLHRLAAALFRLTGQTSSWDDTILVPFQKVGFQAQSIQTTHKTWSSLIILARKPMLGEQISGQKGESST